MLFLPASLNLAFDISCELAVIVALAGFIVLVRTSKTGLFYLWIPLIVLALYVIAGGYVLLSVVLFVMYLLPRISNKYMPAIVATASGLLVPLLCCRFFYTVSSDKIYSILTGLNFHGFFNISLITLCAIPLTGMALKKIASPKKSKSKSKNKNKNGYLFVFVSDILMFVAVLLIITNNRFAYADNIFKMVYYANNNKWNEILDMRKDQTDVDAGYFSSFYTNLALFKSGTMLHKMFYFNQTGTSGLFIAPNDNLSYYFMSELFYQLGLLNEAMQYSFESMIGYSANKEINSANMTRLLACATIKKDSALINKYQNILEKTLFYKNYGNKHKTEWLEKQIPQIKNVLVDTEITTLEPILEKNPQNRQIFEYQMAHHLLGYNYEDAKKCYDTYYDNYSYSEIPLHLAEFLVMYKNFNNLGEDFYNRYPVSVDIRDKFDVMDLLVSSGINNNTKKVITAQFRNTYWYYVLFPPIVLKK